MSNPNNNNNNNLQNTKNDEGVNESTPNNPGVTNDIDQLVAIINNAVNARVPAAVESALGNILDERLAFANQSITNAAVANATTGASAVGSTNQNAPTAAATTAPLPGAPLMGTQCPNCAFLIPAAVHPDDRWYAVLVGRRIGIIKAWHRVNALTSGVSGERKLYCANEDTACRLFHEAQLDGQTRVVTDGTAVTFTYTYQEGILFS
ncbi:hypothetical protein V5O48_014921 [Marasmius crinis-equi]|uniref:Uncharacterized protein n=1 Tax=Marasmius crinis-equi TaxID=585013 RepID=A0ABR3EVY3_9AGAR